MRKVNSSNRIKKRLSRKAVEQKRYKPIKDRDSMIDKYIHDGKIMIPDDERASLDAYSVAVDRFVKKYKTAIEHLKRHQPENISKLLTQPRYHHGELVVMQKLLDCGYNYVFYMEQSNLNSKKHDRIKRICEKENPETSRSLFPFVDEEGKPITEGTPDLLAIKEGRFIFFEVKDSTKSDKVRKNQEVVMRRLRKIRGVSVKVINVC